MREIKFRGRDTDGNWHYGDLLRHVRDSYDMIIPVGNANSDDLYDDVVCVDYDTVGQFTGLLDSNGKEIFEGDILRFAPPLRWEEDERQIGVVVFKYYAFVVKYNDMYTGLFNLAANEAPYTIIGNVYDNPELMEK